MVYEEIFEEITKHKHNLILDIVYPPRLDDIYKVIWDIIYIRTTPTNLPNVKKAVNEIITTYINPHCSVTHGLLQVRQPSEEEIYTFFTQYHTSGADRNTVPKTLEVKPFRLTLRTGQLVRGLKGILDHTSVYILINVSYRTLQRRFGSQGFDSSSQW